MPVVSVGRDKLFAALGRTYSAHRPTTYSTASSLALLLDTSARRVRPGAAEDEFDKLCFEYGIELDDVVRPVDLD